jgi:hypothetical protein
LKIKANGCVANSNFTFLGIGQLQVLYFENFRAAGFVNADGFHVFLAIM